jgi:anti-sigma-K factor RskA
MLLYVTDALDASEQAEVRAHLATGCPACAGALAEAQAVVAHVPMALDRIEPPTSVKQKLMERIDRSESAPIPVTRTPGQSAAPPRISSARSSISRTILTSAIAASIGALIVAATLWWPAQKKVNLVENENVKLVAMAGADLQPKASGKIFWDKQKNDWHVYVFDLKPPAPGQEYELWFITPGQKKIPAGTFMVDASGKASLVVKVPADIGPIALAAVTNEPLGGLPQPSGQVQLLGEVK